MVVESIKLKEHNKTNCSKVIYNTQNLNEKI